MERRRCAPLVERSRAACIRFRAALPQPIFRMRPIRSAMACIRTARSGWRSRSTMRAPATWGRCLEACVATARRWYLTDRDAPAQWEPSGADFLSPCLMEAVLMRRVLDADAFSSWLDCVSSGCRPPRACGLVHAGASSATAATRTSCISMASIFRVRGAGARSARRCRKATRVRPPRMRRRTTHLAAGLEGVASGDYAGDHWLATFAVLALTT